MKPGKGPDIGKQLSFNFSRGPYNELRSKKWLRRKVDITNYDLPNLIPEKRLLACILQQAMSDMIDDCKAARVDAWRWFAGRGDAEFSIEMIAHHLKLDIRVLRSTILEWVEEKRRIGE